MGEKIERTLASVFSYNTFRSDYINAEKEKTTRLFRNVIFENSKVKFDIVVGKSDGFVFVYDTRMKNVNYPIPFRGVIKVEQPTDCVYSLDKIDKNQQILSTFGVGLKHQQPITSTV